MGKVFWEQIKSSLPANGKVLSGDLIISGTLDVAGTLNYNGQEITQYLANISSSNLFINKGTYYETENNLNITGSLHVNFPSTEETFKVSSGSSDILLVSSSGILRLQDSDGTPVEGGLMYRSGSFYIGTQP